MRVISEQTKTQLRPAGRSQYRLGREEVLRRRRTGGDRETTCEKSGPLRGSGAKGGTVEAGKPRKCTT